MNLSELSAAFQRSFEETVAARDKALGASRQSIRASANGIRAIHRGELDQAHRLMEQSLAAIRAGRDAVREAHPGVYFAGFLQDAQKEYAEARITEAVVTGGELPGPEELEVEIPPYLELERSERILSTMEDIYYLLVSMDYPDAITGNLRRSTDVARSLLERTRGDLSVALVQRNLQEALETGLTRLEGSPGTHRLDPGRPPP